MVARRKRAVHITARERRVPGDPRRHVGAIASRVGYCTASARDGERSPNRRWVGAPLDVLALNDVVFEEPALDRQSSNGCLGLSRRSLILVFERSGSVGVKRRWSAAWRARPGWCASFTCRLIKPATPCALTTDVGGDVVKRQEEDLRVEFELFRNARPTRRSSYPNRSAPLSETGRLRLARCVVADGRSLREQSNAFRFRSRPRPVVRTVTASRAKPAWLTAVHGLITDRTARRHTPSDVSSACVSLVRWGPARIAYLLRLETCCAVVATPSCGGSTVPPDVLCAG